MHLVAVYGWQKEVAEVAKIIADTLGATAFEARQKIADGGPAVLAGFADPNQADEMATKLSRQGVPAMVIDTRAVRHRDQPFRVYRFELGTQALRLESVTGETHTMDYGAIELLLVATCCAGMTETTGTVTERKFSLGKTLLAGGVPMTRKVTREQILLSEERDKALWLYAGARSPVIFNRMAMNYDGLGAAMQLTRDLNFSHLTNALRCLAPQAQYDDRLLKRASLIRLLGPTLSPETDFDLAFEILARSLRTTTDLGI